MKKSRPRTERRIEARDAKRLIRDRQRLATLERGGSSQLPIEVPSSAVIEGRAVAIPCVQCEGEAALVEHVREQGLRLVRVKCRRCGAPRDLWFRIVEVAPN